VVDIRIFYAIPQFGDFRNITIFNCALHYMNIRNKTIKRELRFQYVHVKTLIIIEKFY
jgi:hypothetical protein